MLSSPKSRRDESAASGALSILLPVRNAQRTVGAALQDMLACIDVGDEILVVDDGSSDDTPRILAQLHKAHPTIRVLTTSGLGLVGALNLGLLESSHRWVARADADDRYPIGRLRRQRAAITSQVVLVTGDYCVRSGARLLGNIPCAITPPFVVASLIHPHRVPHPGVLLDREAALSVGGYQDEDFPAEDLGLWLRLAHAGNFVGVPTRVVDWTMAASSITHTRQATQRRKTAELLQSRFPIEVVLPITAHDVQRELAAFVGTPLESMRRLLLARDLHALELKGVDSKATKVARTSLLRTPWRSASAARQLYLDKRQRDRVRERFNNATR